MVLVGILFIAALMMANATASVRRVIGYVQGVPTSVELAPIGDGFELRKDAAEAFLRMKAAMIAAGVWRGVNSAFRSMEKQEYLYGLFLAGTGNLAAKPGFSNHQSGVAVDVDGCETTSTLTSAWMAANAGKYGFKRTVSSEPWHWEFA